MKRNYRLNAGNNADNGRNELLRTDGSEDEMQINRYINGKPVSAEELSRVQLVTRELENAVRDARKRADAAQARGENSAEG